MKDTLQSFIERVVSTTFYKKYISNLYQKWDSIDNTIYFDIKNNTFTKKELLDFQAQVELEDSQAFTISPITSATEEIADVEGISNLHLIYKRL